MSKGLRTSVYFLAVIGAIEWGIVGVWSLIGDNDAGLIDLIFDGLLGIPVLESIIYVIVGIAGIMALVDLFKRM